LREQTGEIPRTILNGREKSGNDEVGQRMSKFVGEAPETIAKRAVLHVCHQTSQLWFDGNRARIKRGGDCLFDSRG
jgi:hypothetical protein